MRIFKNKWFQRYARKQGLRDQDLCHAIVEMTNGLSDASYGGHLFKKRIARPGSGKSGGHRAIIAMVFADKAFFMFAFEKSDKDNLSDDEVRTYKELAKDYLGLTQNQLDLAVSRGILFEVICDGKENL